MNRWYSLISANPLVRASSGLHRASGSIGSWDLDLTLRDSAGQLPSKTHSQGKEGLYFLYIEGYPTARISFYSFDCFYIN